jgi:ribosomal protein L24E
MVNGKEKKPLKKKKLPRSVDWYAIVRKKQNELAKESND